jgi:hypothetical protein
MMERLGSSRNSTRTWVTLPVLPVRPSTLFTFASFTGWSCRVVEREKKKGVSHTVFSCLVSSILASREVW